MKRLFLFPLLLMLSWVPQAAQQPVEINLSTVTDLAAWTVTSYQTNLQATVRGTTKVGDGGEGRWHFEPGSTTTTNLGTVVASTGVAGRWKRDYTGGLNVRWFGAKGDGSVDDSAAIQAALDAAPGQFFYDNIAEVYIPAGKYLVYGKNFAYSSTAPGFTNYAGLRLYHAASTANSTTRIRGDGPGSLLYTTRTNLIILVVDGMKHTIVDGLTFGGASSTPWSNDNRPSSTFTASDTYRYSRNISSNWLNGAVGLFIKNTETPEVRNCGFTFLNCGLYEQSTGIGAAVLDHLVFEDNQLGLYWYSMYISAMTGLHFNGNDIAQYWENSHHNTVTGSRSEINGIGLFMTNCTQNALISSHFEQCFTNVYASYTRGQLFRNCTLTRGTTGTYGAETIHLDAGTRDVTFDSCTMEPQYLSQNNRVIYQDSTVSGTRYTGALFTHNAGNEPTWPIIATDDSNRSSRSTVNVLLNGSFEAGTNLVGIVTTNAAVTVDTTKAFEGLRSLRVTPTAGASVGSGTFTWTLPAALQGKRCTFAAWFYASDNATWDYAVNARLKPILDIPGTTTNAFGELFAARNAWTLLMYHFTPDASTTSIILTVPVLYYSATASGEYVCLDSVFLGASDGAQHDLIATGSGLDRRNPLVNSLNLTDGSTYSTLGNSGGSVLLNTYYATATKTTYYTNVGTSTFTKDARANAIFITCVAGGGGGGSGACAAASNNSAGGGGGSGSGLGWSWVTGAAVSNITTLTVIVGAGGAGGAGTNASSVVGLPGQNGGATLVREPSANALGHTNIWCTAGVGLLGAAGALGTSSAGGSANSAMQAGQAGGAGSNVAGTSPTTIYTAGAGGGGGGGGLDTSDTERAGGAGGGYWTIGVDALAGGTAGGGAGQQGRSFDTGVALGAGGGSGGGSKSSGTAGAGGNGGFPGGGGGGGGAARNGGTSGAGGTGGHGVVVIVEYLRP